MTKTEKKYPIETEIEYDYGPKKETVEFFKVPCGDKYPVQYWTKETVIKEHCVKCKVCAILLGYSKRKKGFNQHEVARLFEFDINATSSSENFESYNGILEHYGTIEAIKTLDGIIISNNECFNRGFAYCTKPNYSVSMDLSTIMGMIFIANRQLLREIKIIETKNEAVLFTWRKEFYLNGNDEQGFITKLIMPCKTIKEAYDSMMPQRVKFAKRHNLAVKRQGEYFFIPVPFLKDSGVKDIERIINHKDIGKGYYEKYDWIDEEYVTIERLFPEIEQSRHLACRKGKYLNKTVVKGTVRHPEHRMLNLGQIWHYVVKNTVKESWSVGARGD